MGYADGLLTSGERVVHREKQHWWVFVWGAKWTILAVLASALIFALSLNVTGEGLAGSIRGVLRLIAAAVFIGGIALLIWTTLQYFNQEYVLTNRRVIETRGVVNKRSADSSLEKINDAVLTQSIFGRAFDFGDLKVLTASDAAISEFRMLKRPIKFKKAMLEAKHEYELDITGARGPAPASPPLRAGTEPTSPTEPTESSAGDATASPVAGAVVAPIGDETVATPVPGGPITAATADELSQRLATLADLRDRGAITIDEYEARKAELLSEI